MFKLNDVVQFNEHHKWCGCIGIVEEVKPNRIMVGVPIPVGKSTHIYVVKEDLEYIGNTVLVSE